MTIYKAYTIKAAREKAAKMRKMGYVCSVYKLKGNNGYSITVKRKK